MYPKNGHSHPALSKYEPDAWLHGETDRWTWFLCITPHSQTFVGWGKEKHYERNLSNFTTYTCRITNNV